MENVVEKTLSEIGIIPVIALDDSKKAISLAKALIDGGILCAEVTFRTKEAEEAIKNIVKTYPEMLVGAGTVLNVEQANKAISAGAKFIVSPGFNEDVVKFCIEKNVLCVPGCSNPSEMTKAYNMGLGVVKVFPAENLGGINYIKACSAAIPLKFMPTGGINTKNLVDYVSNEKIFAVGGTWMVKKDLIENEKWTEITNICKEAITTMLGFEIKHVGINCENEEIAKNVASEYSTLLGLPCREASASKFVGNLIECMNTIYLGEKGHIAIATNCVDRAIYHMKRCHIEFNEETRKVNPKTGLTNFIYVKKEIGGFAIHLIQK